MQPEDLPEQPPDAVPHNAVACLARRGHAQAWPSLVVSITQHQNEMRRMDTTPVFLRGKILEPAENAVGLRKSEPRGGRECEGCHGG